MPRRYENKKHLSHVREKNCLCRGVDCYGDVEAHHLMKPWFGYRGMGMKAGDMNVLPLCHKHHMELHDVGNENSFWVRKGHSPDFGRAVALRIWEASPHTEDLSDWKPKGMPNG
jgi:hypothetical protein